MKVGDRVKIASDNHTLGVQGGAFDEVGTIVAQAPGDIIWFDGSATVWIVETDKDTGGHDARGVGKDGHCWNVDERDLEEINSMSERNDIETQLFKRFKSIKGIGSTKAAECTVAAMEYLDSLVEESGANGGCEGAPTDFPWDKIPLEWKWAAWDFDSGDFELRVYREKPEITRLDDGRILWNGDYAPTPKIEDYPPHLKPSTPDEAKEWLFQRPE